MFEKVKNQDHLLGKTNRIVEGTIITGDISTLADFRLDGKLKGNFTSEGKIVILTVKASILKEFFLENYNQKAC